MSSDDEFFDEISDGFYSGEDFEFFPSDDEQEMFNDVFDRPSLVKQKSYIALREEEILSQASKEIEDIMEVLGIPSKSLAVILLRKFQ